MMYLADQSVAFAASPKLRRIEAQLSTLLRRVYGLQLTPTVQSLSNAAPTAVLTQRKVSDILQQLAQLNGRLVVNRSVLRQMRQAVEGLLQTGQIEITDEMRRALRSADTTVAESLPDPERINVQTATSYERAAGELLTQYSAGIRQDIAEEVVRGLEMGLTDQQLGDRLHRLGATKLRSHADTWARTETTRYYTAGRGQMAEAAGPLVWGYRYVVIVDEATTAICRQFVGRLVSKANMTHWPPFHWNCRTTVIAVMAPAVVGGRPRTTLPDNVEQLIPDGFGQAPGRMLEAA